MKLYKGKTYSAKIGTIPKLVVASRNYEIEPGSIIKVRDNDKAHRWYEVRVTEINLMHFMADMV